MTLFLTLASRNLFHDRVRLIATVVGIVFSIVLVTVQLGVFLSFQDMVTTMIDHAQADFWIVPAETKSFEDSSLLAGRERLHALSVDGVTDAIPVIVGYTSWRKPNGGASKSVLLVGAPITADGLYPWDVVEGSRDNLSVPDSVAIDRSYATQLGVAHIGGKAEINNQKARVVAMTRGIRSFTTTPYVFVDLKNARSLTGTPPDRVSDLLVRLKPDADRDKVIEAIRADVGDADVLTTAEFRERSRSFWLFGTGAGAALFAGALLGVIVGTVIVAQTLYSSTKDHLNEFATLRAIGSSRNYIYKVIICQALLNAVIGFSIAAMIGAAVVHMTASGALPIVITPELMVALFVLTVVMCIVSAIAAIMKVTRIDPAMVFTR